MKNLIVVLTIFCTSLLASCVQKSYEQTVTVLLDVSSLPNVKTVGVRGEGKPLSWDTDLPLREVIKDSLYTTTIKTTTGYLSTEIKFTINGELELKEDPNRKVVFDVSKKTLYEAKFNVAKP
jgi:hypothetical protein